TGAGRRSGRAVSSARRLGIAVGLTSLVWLTPVVAGGALPGFADYVLGEKPEYWRVMSPAFFPDVGSAFGVFSPHGGGARVLAVAWFSTVHVLLFILLGYVLFVAQRALASNRDQAVIAFSFVVVAVASALPRFGPQHLGEMMVLLLPSVVVVGT